MLTNFLKISTLFFNNMFWRLENKEKHVFKAWVTSPFKGGIEMLDSLKEISVVELRSYRKPQEVV